MELVIATMQGLTYRLATVEDASSILEIYAPIIDHTPISFEETAPSVQEMRQRIAKILIHYPWIVATDGGGQVLGYVYACAHRERLAYKWSVDVAVYVREGFRGQGLAKSLYQKLFKMLPQQNFYRAYAGITLPNEASVKLHENLGFSYVGTYRGVGYKQGKWRDVGWWELKLRETDHAPEAPLKPLEGLC